MLGIKVNNAFLDLNKSAAIEMQLNSPLFLSDDIYSDFSYTLQIPYTEKNVRLLGDIFFEEAKISNWYECEVHDGLNFLFHCKLVIDKPNPNTRNRGKGYVEGYLLGGIGNFFYDLKYKRLGQLNLGGVRSFTFTTWEPYDGSGGFWQHLHATWDGTYDYVCLPFMNEAKGGLLNDKLTAVLAGWYNRLDYGHLYTGYGFEWTDIGPDDDDSYLFDDTYGRQYIKEDTLFINFVDTGNNDVRMITNFYPVVSIKIKYLFEQLCAENGWTLDASLLANENFDKMILIGNTPIRFEFNNNSATPTTVNFKLGDLVSPDIMCVDFIIQHCKRYGWIPNVDAGTRTLKLIPLKNISLSDNNDWTKYADINQQIDASANNETQAVRRFSFKNNFSNADSFPSPPNWNDYVIGETLPDAESLPTPSSVYDNVLILCVKENAYYGIVFNDDLPLTNPVTQSRKWEWVCDNIYNEEKTNNTDSFETSITPMPSHATIYRSDASGNKFYGSFLRCNTQQNQAWGMRTVFYWGLVTEQKTGLTVSNLPKPNYDAQLIDYLTTYGNIAKLLSAGTLKYPFASETPVLPDGTVVGKWANVYKQPATAPYKGIIDYWFNDWLKINDNAIAITLNLNLPLFEIAKLNFTQTVNIKNNPYLLTQLVLPVPYQGTAKAILQPVILNKTELQQNNIPYNGTIYLKAVWENLANYPDETDDMLSPFGGYGPLAQPITNIVRGCFKIYAYSDKEGTQPLSPNNISIFIIRKKEYTIVNNGQTYIRTQATQPYLININSPVTIISKDALELYSYIIKKTATSIMAVDYSTQVNYIITTEDYEIIN